MDLHQLADYHASRTAIRLSPITPYAGYNFSSSSPTISSAQPTSTGSSFSSSSGSIFTGQSYQVADASGRVSIGGSQTSCGQHLCNQIGGMPTPVELFGLGFNVSTTIAAPEAKLGGMVLGGVIKGVIKETRVIAEPVYKTTKEAKSAAEALGFQKINETVHNGQAVFRRGKDFITRDLDGHNGGAWKLADSVKNLGSKETRSGTFDINLNRIGD